MNETHFPAQSLRLYTCFNTPVYFEVNKANSQCYSIIISNRTCGHTKYSIMISPCTDMQNLPAGDIEKLEKFDLIHTKSESYIYTRHLEI